MFLITLIGLGYGQLSSRRGEDCLAGRVTRPFSSLLAIETEPDFPVAIRNRSTRPLGDASRVRLDPPDPFTRKQGSARRCEAIELAIELAIAR